MLVFVMPCQQSGSLIETLPFTKIVLYWKVHIFIYREEREQNIKHSQLECLAERPETEKQPEFPISFTDVIYRCFFSWLDVIVYWLHIFQMNFICTSIINWYVLGHL